MVATDKIFAGSIPEVYDRLLVPLIFEPYAVDLGNRLAKTAPQSVLEIAAGTGVLTRVIASRLPALARIVATDLNQPMLDQAAARQSGDERIAWRQADAQALPFEDQSFDVAACQFGVMFFPDKVLAFKEVRRVLRRGGHFFFNVCCHAGAGRSLSRRSSSFHGPHASRLSRCGSDPRTPDGRRFYRHLNRCRRTSEQGVIPARSRDCLLSRNAVAQRN